LKTLLLSVLLFPVAVTTHAQTPSDSSAAKQEEMAGDDPSQFISRAEVFNELQHHRHNDADFYLNISTFRTVVKIGKRFTTRVDIPLVYNSLSSAANYGQFGLSDISFRLLGYKFLQSRRSAFTASLEVSLKTASSPLLGTGKNIIIPMITYTSLFDDKRTLAAFIFQQGISFSGNEKREDISFSKLQGVLLYAWSKKVWTVIAPELYIDYIHGGASMNLEGRIAFAPVRRINMWAQGGVGLFGDYIARYQWSAEVGGRYFFLRQTKRNNPGSGLNINYRSRESAYYHI
jgi:hypothetical protein